MKSSFGWIQKDYVSWHQLLTASSWNLWLILPVVHLLELLKGKLLRRYVKPFICLMISQRCVANNKYAYILLACVSVFSCKFDFLQEEKLEPLGNITDDPWIRLLNRLYARKRRELREREKLKVVNFFVWFCVGSFLTRPKDWCLIPSAGVSK